MQYQVRRSPRATAAKVVIASMGVLAAAAALLSLPVSSPAFAAASDLAGKADHFLTASKTAERRSGWSQVIVQTTGGDMDSSREASLRSLGGYVYRHLDVIDAAAVRIPNRSLARLAALPWVERLSTDAPVKKHDEFTVERSGANVALGSYGLTGAGVTVAVLDSGVDTWHPDLRDPSNGGATRVLAGVGFVAGSNSASDGCGHGTHVAGIIAGGGNNSTGSSYYRTFYGVARRANIVNVRVLNNYGQGSVSDVIKGIEWVVNNRAAYNIRVINLSLGHPVGESYATDPLCVAVEKAYRAGIVVVTAAGNSGRKNAIALPGVDNEGFGTNYGSIQSPANSPFVITVGAMKASPQGRAYDRVATYSSRGPSRIDLVMKPDIVAPGNRIISLTKNSSYLDNNFKATNAVKKTEYAYGSAGNDSNSYFRLSGTSMAAPVVSGAVALLLEKDPTLTPDTVKARLMVTADKWVSSVGTGDPLTYGAGYLNIPAALNATLVAKAPAFSPLLVRVTSGSQVYVDPSRVIWGPAEYDPTQPLLPPPPPPPPGTTVPVPPPPTTTDPTLGHIWGIEGVNSLRIIWGGASFEPSLDLSLNLLSASRVIWGEAVWMDRIIWDIIGNEVDLSSKAIYGEE